MAAIDLATFKRRFVRAKGDPSEPDYDPAGDDTLWMGISCAEMAAHYDEIDCAACGSADICRTPMSRPDTFCTITTEAGHCYGYALCGACNGDRAAAITRVDAAFKGGVPSAT